MRITLKASDVILRKAVSLFIVLFALIGCSLIAIMVLLYQSENESSELKRDAQLTQAIVKQHHIITSVIGSITDDLIFFSNQNELMAFLDTGDEKWIPSIENEFIILLKTKGIYDQLRLLDNTGKERIRVNYNDGQVSAVETAHLQDKADRYYFKEAIALDRGAIYVSPFDLNVENGAIEQPLRPIIRMATPVFDAKNEKRGILVINYLADRMLSAISRYDDEAVSDTMLINADAFWLLCSEPNQAWGFMIDDRRDHRFSLRYPEAWPFISNHPKGQINTKNGLFVFERVFPMLEARILQPDGATPGNPPASFFDQYTQYYWTLIHHIPAGRLASVNDSLVRKYFYFSISLLIIIAPGSWVMALETTRRRAQDAQLADLAMVDPLTGLHNRRAFNERLERGIEHASRYGRKLGLLFIDLDGFKAINDTKGHDIGDTLLVKVAARLRNHSRKTDVVARLGGDEFVCILSEIDSVDGALQAGKKLVAVLKRPFNLDTGEAGISASIGAAVFPDHASDVNTLIKAADEAMYQTKINGKDNCMTAQAPA